jgi:excisionase family DNA binding protein
VHLVGSSLFSLLLTTHTAQPLLTTREVATLLGVSMETVRDYVLVGRLPAVRLSSRTLRFRVADVEATMTPVETVEARRGH